MKFSARKINYRRNPQMYLQEREDEDIFQIEPYSSQLFPFFKFHSVEEAQVSTEQIFYFFRRYLDDGDFVGADMASRFLEHGYRSFWKNGQRSRLRPMDESREIAQLFKSKWDLARMDPQFLSLQQATYEHCKYDGI